MGVGFGGWVVGVDRGREVIIIRTFGYRWRKPSDVADVVVDCRSLRNPYRDKKLRYLDGLHPAVKVDVQKSPGFTDFYYKNLERIQLEMAGRSVLDLLLVEVGCFGGKHRSVVIGELLARDLKIIYGDVEVEHTSPTMEQK